jgi:hypothetical protein
LTATPAVLKISLSFSYHNLFVSKMSFSASRVSSSLASLFLRKASLLRLGICVGVYALLVVWLWQWSYTGDGDSMLHYWNLRITWLDPKLGLTVWARPLYVLLMIVPAQFGLVAARCFAALATTLLVWQTMRLADDLKLPNATLAGLLLLFQPFTFALASDTMTEIPMALGLTLALRLWWATRFAASCLLVSFLPLVRPEGFLLMPVWGLFLLALPRTSEFPSWPQRFVIGASLATGMIGLLIVCRLVTGEWLYFVTEWSWRLTGVTKGSFWHHFVHWPQYCGWVLLPLFLVGVMAACRRVMALPWAAWLVVILAHTLMHWTGTFEALGLMRILVTTAPVTALLCLYGWNALARLLRAQQWPEFVQRGVTVFVMLLAMVTAMIFYHEEPLHHRFKLARAAAAFVREQQLLAAAPRVFAADPIVLAELDVAPREVWLILKNPHRPPFDEGLLVRHIFDREKSVAQMNALPPGTVGVWDNDQGRWWYHILPEEFPALGYTVLHQTKQTERDFAMQWPDWMKKILLGPFLKLKYGIPEHEYVVVQKNGE